jgi:endonuclease/exonuclease/phosphatase family metal-dependent hydrolase
MSYNIHKCIGSIDRKYRPERIIETIKHYNPDIVLLQEVDKGVKRSNYDNQVDLLADRLEFDYRLFQANVKLKNGCYGNAILSHYSLSNHSNIDLTVKPKKIRRSLAVQIMIKNNNHTRSVKFMNVHLGLAAYERAIQVKHLVNHAYNIDNPHNLPVVIGGDFNDLWQNLCRKVLYANDFTPVLGKTKTFPSFLPSRALDRIFYRGELHAIHSFAGHTKLARAASDHLPIIADFIILL